MNILRIPPFAKKLSLRTISIIWFEVVTDFFVFPALFQWDCKV